MTVEEHFEKLDRKITALSEKLEDERQQLFASIKELTHGLARLHKLIAEEERFYPVEDAAAVG